MPPSPELETAELPGTDGDDWRVLVSGSTPACPEPDRVIALGSYA